jgi:molybdopterin-guanine dinucleotide biosynthesis protein A
VGGYAAVILAGGAGRRLGGATKPLIPVGGRTMLDRVLAAVADATPRIVVGPAELAVPPGVIRISEHPPGGGPVAALAAALGAARGDPSGDLGRRDPIEGVPSSKNNMPALGAGTRGRLEAAQIGALRARAGPPPLDTSGQPPAADRAAVDLAAADLAAVDWAATVVLAADLPFLTVAAVARLRAVLDESTVDGVVYVDGEGRRQTLCGIWRTDALRRRLVDRPGQHHGAALRDFLRPLRVEEITNEATGPPPWYDCDSPEDLDRAEGWA